MPLAHIQSTINVTLLLTLDNLIMSIYLVALPFDFAANPKPKIDNTGQRVEVG